MNGKHQSSSLGGFGMFFKELPSFHASTFALDLCKCPGNIGLFEASEDDNLHKLTLEYSWLEITQATVGLSEANVIGRGHASTVYKGRLEEGIDAAIKVIEVPLDGSFAQEVQLLSRCHHPNVVMLLGFATEGIAEPMGIECYPDESYAAHGVNAVRAISAGRVSPVISSMTGLRSQSGRGRRALVYELLPDGNALERLHSQKPFNFRERLRTAIGASRGLAHLHKHRPEVFHRDIKTGSILFGTDGNAKIADFGLACASGSRGERWSNVTLTSGTPGYAAPEYARTSVVTEASEVYSMGMVIIELLTAQAPAKPCTDSFQRSGFTFLLETIRPELDHAEQRLLSMLDARAQWPQMTAIRLARFCLLCIHEDVRRRPTFVEMVTMLTDFLDSAPNPSLEIPIAQATTSPLKEQAPMSPQNASPKSPSKIAVPQSLAVVEDTAGLESIKLAEKQQGAAPSSNSAGPPAAVAAVPSPARASAAVSTAAAATSGDSVAEQPAIGNAAPQEAGWRGVWATIMRRPSATPVEGSDVQTGSDGPCARPNSPRNQGKNAISEQESEEGEETEEDEEKTRGGRWINWLPFGNRESKKEAAGGNGKEDGDVDLSRISAPCHAELMRTQSNAAVNGATLTDCRPLAAPAANSTVGGASILQAISSPSSGSIGILPSSLEAEKRRTASSGQQCAGSSGADTDGEDLARLVENALNISSRPNSVDEKPKAAWDGNDAAVAQFYPEHASMGRLHHICELSP